MKKIVNKIVNQLLTTFFAAVVSVLLHKADKYKRSLRLSSQCLPGSQITAFERKSLQNFSNYYPVPV